MISGDYYASYWSILMAALSDSIATWAVTQTLEIHNKVIVSDVDELAYTNWISARSSGSERFSMSMTIYSNR